MSGGNFIRRTWVFDDSVTDVFNMWDMGNEIWELKEGILSHYRVVERRLLEFPKKLEEVLEVLANSPVPLQAIARSSVSGWSITSHPMNCPKKAVIRAKLVEDLSPGEGTQGLLREELPQEQLWEELPQLPQAQEREKKPQAQEREKKPQAQEREKKPRPREPAQQKLVQPAHSLKSTKTSEITTREQSEASQDDASLSSESSHNLSLLELHSKQLWSSLSQWIPPNTLFQPSLHQQALLELSDKCQYQPSRPRAQAHQHRARAAPSALVTN